eukprot:6888-Heterococcus_DN1.PRE.2
MKDTKARQPRQLVSEKLPNPPELKCGVEGAMLKALHPTTAAAAAATTESFILVPVLQELSKWRTQAPTGKTSSYTDADSYVDMTFCISLLRPIVVQYCKRTTYRASSRTHKAEPLHSFKYVGAAAAAECCQKRESDTLLLAARDAYRHMMCT